MKPEFEAYLRSLSTEEISLFEPGIRVVSNDVNGRIRIAVHSTNPQNRHFETLASSFNLDTYKDALFPAIPEETFKDTGIKGIYELTVKWGSIELAILDIMPNRSIWNPQEERYFEPLAIKPGEFLKVIKSMNMPAWEIEENPGAGFNVKGSRFYGAPWVPDSAVIRKNVDRSLQTFLFQIAIEELPDGIRSKAGSTGIISVFLEDDQTIHAYRFNTSEPGEIKGDYTKQSAIPITFGEAFDDYPHLKDMVHPDMDLPEDVYTTLDRISLTTRDNALLGRKDPIGDALKKAFTNVDIPKEIVTEWKSLANSDRNKAGGWPTWQSSRKWPTNDKLDHHFLFQINAGQLKHQSPLLERHLVFFINSRDTHDIVAIDQ